jgi:serine/threonine protein kinase
MAPEAIRRKKYSEKSDVWSLGIVAKEILTMHEPYPDMDAVQAATEVCAGTVDLSPPAGTPPDLAAILIPCQAIDPDERPTFVTLAEQLQALNY